MRQGAWPLSPLFWLALIVLVIQSLVLYAGEAVRSEDELTWALPTLVGIGVVVLAVAVLLVWRWRLWVPAVLLAAGTALAYLGLVGWLFGVLLVVTGIVVSLRQASPSGRVQVRRVNWSQDADGAHTGPVAVLVGLAVLVLGLQLLAAYVSAKDLVLEATVGLVDDPFRVVILVFCAVMLVVIAATYAVAYRAWLSGLCLVIAAGGVLLGFFVLVPTASFALLAIALSFVEPAPDSPAPGRVIEQV